MGMGDMELTDRCFTIDRKSHVLTMTDFQEESGKQSVTLEGGQMAKLLRYIVHTLEIFMWDQDYVLIPDQDDFLIDLLPEYRFKMEEDTEDTIDELEGSPTWRAQVEYSNHTEQDTSGYTDYLPECPEDLYLSLMEYFEPEDEII